MIVRGGRVKGNLTALVISAALVLLPRAAAWAQTICAEVRLEIKQEATLEREAFDAALEVTNQYPAFGLTNFRVNILIKDPQGRNADNLFFVKISSKEAINAVDGTGVVQPASTATIHWLIIPSTGAGGTNPLGVVYSVKADISYLLNGVAQTISTFEDNIQVKPQPALRLEYVLPFEVFADEALTETLEPVEPFPLGARITNVGYGPARNFQINSGQPEIIENKQGLAIDFKLLGTYVGDKKIPDTLLIPFGDISAGGVSQAAWIMATSLSGRFIKFDASFTHAAELGGQLTSLIQDVTTYTLVKDVLVDLPGRDGQFDFLVNTTIPRAQLEALLNSGQEIAPELILESDQAEPIQVVRLTSELIGDLNGANTSATLRLTQSVGSNLWVFTSMPAPQDGRAKLVSAVRQDGKVISLKNIWLSRHFNKDSGDSSYRLNLIDYNPPPLAGYTLDFSRESLDAAPAAITDLGAFALPVGGQIGLNWSATGEDAGSGAIIGGSYLIQAATSPLAEFTPALAQVSFATNTAPGLGQTYLLQDLAGNASYYLKLWLQDTGGGISGDSNLAEGYALPRPPADLVAGAISSDTVAVSWNGGNNNLPIEYGVWADTDSVLPAVSAAPFKDPFDRAHVFAGLTPNTTYLFYGLASNPATGASSEQVLLGAALTLAAAPGAALSTQLFASSFTVAWDGSANNPITEYFVQISTITDWSLIAAESGWAARASYTFSGLTPDTTYYARAKARNSAGVETAYADLGAFRTLFLDVLPPVTELAFAGPVFGVEPVFVSSFTGMSLNSCDDALVAGDRRGGPVSLFYSVNSDTFSVYAGTFSFADGGSYLVRYYGADAAGNVEEVRYSSITVDAAAPEVSLEAAGVHFSSAGILYVSAASTAALTAADGASGVREIYYDLNGSTYTVASGAVALALAEGFNTVGYYASDNVGNVAQARVSTAALDAAAPEALFAVAGASLTIGGALYLAPGASITVSAQDALSGVLEVRYSLDGATAAVAAPLALAVAPGAHEFGYYAVDNVGNSGAEAVRSFFVDAEAPLSTAAILGAAGAGGWNISPVTLVLESTDAMTGVAATMFAVSFGEVLVSSGDYSSPLILSSEGLYGFSYRSLDRLGNLETERTGEFKIDTSSPSLVPVVSPPANGQGWHNAAVAVVFDGSDTVSGLAYCTPPAALEAEGAGLAVSGQCSDNAGLVSSVTVTVNLDFTAPTTVLEIGGESYSDGTRRFASASGSYARLLSIDSLSGTSRVYYSADPSEALLAAGLGAQTAEQFAVYADTFPFTAGSRSLAFGALDLAGNYEALRLEAVYVDGTPPAVQLYVGTAAVQAGAAVYITERDSVTISAVDPEEGIPASGLKAVSRRIDVSPQECEAAAPPAACADVEYTGPFSLTVGTHSVYYHAEDNVGNLSVVSSVTLFVQQVAGALPPGAIAYWKFDEGAGLVAADASGNGNAGTLNGAVWAVGKAGKSLLFDGVEDFMSVPSSELLNSPSVTGQVSLAGWYNIRDLAALGGDCANAPAKFDGNGLDYGLFICDSGSMRVRFHIGGNVVDYSAPHETGVWAHFAVTYDGATARIYKNGAEVASGEGAFAIGASAAAVLLGKHGAGLPRYDGRMDEVLIYNRGLTPAEVTRIYEAHAVNLLLPTVSATVSGPTGADGWYVGDATVTVSAQDNSGTGIKELRVCVDQAGTCSPQPGGVALVSVEGVNYVRYKAEDNAGNVDDPVTLVVRLDKSAPEVAARAGGRPAADGATLQLATYESVALEASDPVSGMRLLLYSLDAPFSPESALEYAGAFRLAEGTHTVRYAGLDNAGNYSAVKSLSLSVTAPAPGAIPAGAMGYWRFNEGSGAAAADSSGNGNTGVITGASWTEGISGKGLDFDGVDDEVLVPNSESLASPAYTGAVSVAGWYNIRDLAPLSGDCVNAPAKYDESGLSYGLFICNADWMKVRFHTGGDVLDYNIPHDLGEWTHYAATYDGWTARIYKNGEEVANRPGQFPMPDITGGLIMGRHGETPERRYSGGLDEVAVYARGLSAEEVAALWQAGYAPPVSLTLAPSSGAIGVPFSIAGGVFGVYSAGVTRVLVGGQAAPLTIWSDSAIKGTIPGGLPPGVYPVTVLRGTATLAEAGEFAVVLPEAAAIVPSSGAIGVPFEVTGGNFGNYVADYTRVLIGGVAAPLTLWVDGRIRGTVPGELAAGEHELVIERALNGGVSRSAAVPFLVRAPEMTGLSPAAGPIGMPFTITGEGFGNYNSTYTRVEIGGIMAPLTLWSETRIQGTIPGGLSPGQYPAVVERHTADGGVMRTTPIAFMVAGLEVSSMTPVSGPIGLPFTVYGSNFGNYVANCTRVLIGGATAPLTLWSGDRIQGTVPGLLPPGEYPLAVERELNGEVVRSSTLTFTVSVPTAGEITPSTGPIGAPFTINGVDFGNYAAGYTRVLIGGATAPLTLWNDTQITGTIPGSLGPGEHSVMVERALNGGITQSAPLTFTVMGVSVASMSPVAGPIGVPFTVYGADFGNYAAGYTRVLIGGATAPLTLWSETLIKGTVPGGLAAGEHQLIVERNLNGGQVQSQPLAFSVISPAVSGVTPSSGPIGLPFSINGGGFGNYVANYTRVLIGGATAPLTSWGDTQIKGTVPGGLAAGEHEAYVERALNGGLARSSTFTFTVGAPYLGGVTPSTAAVLAPFTLTGYNFGNYAASYTRVLVNGATTALTLWTDSQIKGKLPPLAAGEYPVLVQRNLNGGLSESATGWITIEAPVISSMTPASGAAGTVFNLYGTGFGPYDAAIAHVTMGGAACALSLWTDTNIRGTVPSALSYGTHTVVASRGQALSNGLDYVIPGGYTPSLFRAGVLNAEFKLGEVYVYPNPAKGGKVPVFHIEVGTADSVKLKVFTVAGQLTHEHTLTGVPQVIGAVYAYEYAWEGRIASGVYYYAIEAERSGKKIKAKGRFAVVR